VGDKQQKWSSILQNINDLCASKLPVIDELYKSESVTNHNNRAIAWLLKNYNRIYDEPDMSLDLYTRQCSLGVTTSELQVSRAL
jgi:glutaminase